MNQKLSSALIELIRDACWKAFWRHNALKMFLQQHAISANVLSTWDISETKKEFIDRLFSELLGLINNSGHKIILNMGFSLAEMNHFPDLENQEDSTNKIKAATDAVARLKQEIDKINHNKETGIKRAFDRKREQDNLEKIQSKNSSFESLKKRLDQLASNIGTQQAGYDFEKWFYDLATFSEIQARPPYKDTNGRQIDGSITLDGTTFLIEAKFQQNPAKADDVDSFFAKIERKADNTMGIMIAMSGFDEGAKRAASKDRTTLLLMDHSHLYSLVLNKAMTLAEVVNRIKRHASQSGESYLDVKNFSK
ncbi:MAG: restriction endonuclease [Thermoguttaceae bacterium]